MLTSSAARRFAIAAASVIALAGGTLAVHADTLSQRVLNHTFQNLVQTPEGPTGGFPVVPMTCAPGANPCVVDLAAGTGTATVHDSVNGTQNIPFWGFGVNGQPAGLAGTPSSIIKVMQGTTLTINLTQDPATGAGIDLSFPDLSLGAVSHSGNTYTVVADRVGTSLFEPGADAEAPKQISMGLVGILIVVPTSCSDATNYACAYTSTGYEDEKVVAFGTLDPEFAANPNTFDMTYFGQVRTADNKPRRVYHTINGKAFPDTDQIDMVIGETLLLRYVNASETEVVPNLVGINQSVLARNDSTFSDAQRQVAPLVMPGETVEATVTAPVNGWTGQNFALTNQVRDWSHGNTHGFGGALTFISLWTH